MDSASTSLEQQTASTSYTSVDQLEQNVSSQAPSSISFTNNRNHLKPLHPKDVNPINVLNKKRKLTSEFDDSLEDVFVPSKVSTKLITKNDKKKMNNNKKTKRNNPVIKKKCIYFNSPQSLQYTQSSNYEEDLKLALALSLGDAPPGEGSSQGDSGVSEEPQTTPPVIPPLKRSPRLLKKWNGKSKKSKSKSILLRRTEEDRERIITQKVGIVFLENASKIKIDDFFLTDIELKSLLLENCFNKNAPLWELSKSSLDNEALMAYWVSDLVAYVEPITTMDIKDGSDENKETVKESELEESAETFFPCLAVPETTTGEELCSLKENYIHTIEVAKSSDYLEETNADSVDIKKSSSSEAISKIPSTESDCSNIQHDIKDKDGVDFNIEEESGMRKLIVSQEVETSLPVRGASEDFEESIVTQKTVTNSLRINNSINEECHLRNLSITSENIVPKSPFHSGIVKSTELCRISSSSVETVKNSPNSSKNDGLNDDKMKKISITSHEHSLPFSNFKFITRSERSTEKNNSHSFEKLSRDWEAIFGNIETSDIKVQLGNNKFYPLHKLVLKVRCPQILTDISETEESLNWTHYSYNASLAVLKFIYTGQTNHFENLTDDDKEILSRINKDYNLNISDSLQFWDTQSVASDIYSTSTQSPPMFENVSEIPRNLSFTPEVPRKLTFSPEFPRKLSFSPEIPSVSGTSFREKACASTPNDFKNTRAISPDIFETDIIPESNTFEKIFSENQSECKNIVSDFKSEENNCEKSGNSFRPSTSVWNISDVLRDSVNTTRSEIKIEQKSETVLSEGTSKLTSELEIPSSKTEEFLSNNFSNTDNVEFQSNNDDFYHDFSYYDSYPNEYDNPPNELQRNHGENVDENISSVKPSFEGNPSKRSIDKYFQSSFPEIDVDEMHNGEAKDNGKTDSPEVRSRNLQSTVRIASACRTPKLENSIIIDKATPQQNYGIMDTPDLKNELKKYGLKPTLGRRKADMLLRYIYEQTHPPVSQIPGYVSPVPSAAPLDQRQAENSVVTIDSD